MGATAIGRGDSSTPATSEGGRASSLAPEYQSVASPCLVSAVCRLLSNLLALAPQDTLACVHAHGLHGTLLR